MAGLSILLEAQKGSYRKGPKIISKTAFLRPTSPSSSSTLTLPATTFLDVCFLCQKRLSPSKDIYMYRGDRAFCSEECRCRQIYLDEESVKRENCSLAAMKPISSSSSSPSSSSSSSSSSSGALKKNKSRAGGFAY